MKSVVIKRAVFLALLCVVPTMASAKPARTVSAGGKPAHAVSAVAKRSATDVVKNFYAQLTSTMKQGEALEFSGRYQNLEPVLRQTFNFQLMTRFAVGLAWNGASAKEREAVVSAFSDFSVATYASRFATYDGEQFTVIGETTTKDGKIVETTLKPKEGEAVVLNYLLRQDETGAWRICDVFLNGAISELATRRSEFSAVIKRDGLAALITSLEEKSKHMGAT